MSKAQRIEAMLAKGKSPAYIAEKLGTTKQYVYTISSKKRKATKKIHVAKQAEVRKQAPTFWQRIRKWLTGE